MTDHIIPPIKEAIEAGVTSVKNAISDTASRVADAIPSTGDLRAGADWVNDFVTDNPLGIALGSVAAGFLVGLLLPRTAIEAERVKDVQRLAKDAGVAAMENG